VLEFSERTFYAFKARPVCARAANDVEHKRLILSEWSANYACYGARRLHKHLRRQGHQIARCTVTRLMRDMEIRGVQRGRRHFTTHPDKTAGRPPDLVKRVFVADAPNRLWLADITYCSTWKMVERRVHH
jgi:putative transposase